MTVTNIQKNTDEAIKMNFLARLSILKKLAFSAVPGSRDYWSKVSEFRDVETAYNDYLKFGVIR